MSWQKDLKNSKFRRVKQWRSQSYFDKELLQTRDLSGLRQLSKKYHNEIIEFSRTHDLNVSDNLSIFQSMKQKYKMINEEIAERTADIRASPTYYGGGNKSFYPSSGIIWDHQTDSIECTVEFNEDETEVIKRDDEGNIIEKEIVECNEIDKPKEKKRTLRDIYKNWKY